MTDALLDLVAYASVCYDEFDACDKKKRTHSTDTSPLHTVLPKKKLKHTRLDVQVQYEQDARVVYLRNKVCIGPLLSHMHADDIYKIFPVHKLDCTVRGKTE